MTSESEVDLELVKWLKKQVDTEVERIQMSGGRSIPMAVKNTGITMQDNKIINRIEFNTMHDFDTIEQIMISNSIVCPLKANFKYANVLLFTKAPLPIIFGYLYRDDATNDLSEWVFINNQGKRSRHKVDRFESVKASKKK